MVLKLMAYRINGTLVSGSEAIAIVIKKKILVMLKTLNNASYSHIGMVILVSSISFLFRENVFFNV